MARPTAVEVKLLLREKRMCWVSGCVGGPPAFGDDVAVAEDHEAVHAVDLGVEGFDEVEEGARGDAL